MSAATKKRDLHYLAGGVFCRCDRCRRFIPACRIHSSYRDRVTEAVEPRCELIGKLAGRGYRIRPDYVCDKFLPMGEN